MKQTPIHIRNGDFILQQKPGLVIERAALQQDQSIQGTGEVRKSSAQFGIPGHSTRQGKELYRSPGIQAGIEGGHVRQSKRPEQPLPRAPSIEGAGT